MFLHRLFSEALPYQCELFQEGEEREEGEEEREVGGGEALKDTKILHCTGGYCPPLYLWQVQLPPLIYKT